MKTEIQFVDPPSGWKYGFPKAVPLDCENVVEWIIANGYPRHIVESMGEHFIIRSWYESD